MKSQRYQQIIASLCHTCATLSLQLPTHATAIAAQQRNIQSICAALETMEPEIRALAYRSWNPLQRKAYQSLYRVLRRLILEANTMTLLAEEFSADPEGSVSCLHAVNHRKDRLIKQLHHMTFPGNTGYAQVTQRTTPSSTAPSVSSSASSRRPARHRSVSRHRARPAALS